MKFYNYIAVAVLVGCISSTSGIKLIANNKDEVDDLMDKQDQKDS